MTQTITVLGGTLFDVALTYYGDATAWTDIAAANRISDPWLMGLTSLVIPDNPNPTGSNGQ